MMLCVQGKKKKKPKLWIMFLFLSQILSIHAPFHATVKESGRGEGSLHKEQWGHERSLGMTRQYQLAE
jgi:hypothetical protein